MTELPSELSLTVGDRHELELPGLGTAGYRWDESLGGDTGAVDVDWQRGVSAEEAAGRPVGASVPERLTITAATPGHVTLTLAQRRPWETGPPRVQHVIEVDVDPA